MLLFLNHKLSICFGYNMEELKLKLCQYFLGFADCSASNLIHSFFNCGTYFNNTYASKSTRTPPWTKCRQYDSLCNFMIPSLCIKFSKLLRNLFNGHLNVKYVTFQFNCGYFGFLFSVEQCKTKAFYSYQT